MKLVKVFRYLILGAVGLAVTAIPIFDIALIVMNAFGLIAMKWDDVLATLGLSLIPFLSGVLAFAIVNPEEARK